MLDKKFILAPTPTDLDEEIWWEICTAPSGSEIAFIDEPKDQAAIAMEQRAEVAGKDAAASVYRKFIEEQKRKTKEKNA